MIGREPELAHDLPLTHAGLLIPLLRYAEREGVDVHGELRRAGLPAALSDHPDALVSTAGWHELYRNVARETGHSDLGWRVGYSGRLSGHSHVFTEGISQAPTLLAALRWAAKAGSRECSSHRMRILVLGAHAFVIHTNPDRTPGYEQRNVARLATLVRTGEAFHGPGWRPDLIVTETSRDILPRNGELDGVPVLQRRGWSALRFPRAQLAADCQAEITSSHRFSEAPAPGLQGQLKQLLASYVFDELPGLAELAELTHQSQRSLQRRLRELGTSYRLLTREVRFEAARGMLANPQMSVTEVAAMLRYEDSSHFSRFFRRISGVSPKEFRLGLDDGTYQGRWTVV